MFLVKVPPVIRVNGENKNYFKQLKDYFESEQMVELSKNNLIAVEVERDFELGNISALTTVDPNYVLLLGSLFSISEESFNFAMSYVNNINNLKFESFIFDLSKVRFSSVIFNPEEDKLLMVHLFISPFFYKEM